MLKSSRVAVSFLMGFLLLGVAQEAEAARSKKKEEVKEPQIDASANTEPQIRVKVSGRRGGIRKIPLETYLAGVIGSEMNRSWPLEALKAQAVAARSYALSRMMESRSNGLDYDVVDTQADQVFRKSHSVDSFLRNVVQQTRGLILQHRGKVVRAFYSSTCGGKTRSARTAGLLDDSPLTKTCTDSYCTISPFRNWDVSFTLQDIEKRFNANGHSLANLRSVKVNKKDKTGYVLTMTLTDDRGRTVIPAKEFRKIMGYKNVKSLLFATGQSGETVSVHGKGFGHGVGLCQFGAKEMANHGLDYQKILNKYYPQISLVQYYP